MIADAPNETSGRKLMDKILEILAEHPWLLFVLWFGGSGVGAGGSYIATTQAIEKQVQGVDYRVSSMEDEVSSHEEDIEAMKDDIRNIEIQMTRIEGSQAVTNEKLSGIERIVERIDSNF